jgi:hypothetical protein
VIDGIENIIEMRLRALATIVEAVVKANPSANVTTMAEQLLVTFALYDTMFPNERNETGTQPRKSDHKHSHDNDDCDDNCDDSQPVAHAPIDAPFPESSMGADVYDPVQAVAHLPEFNELPTVFVDQHSVIRSGDRTVIMNAAHYADLLKARDTAKQAVEDEQVMRQAAAAMSQYLANIETILKLAPERQLTLIADDNGDNENGFPESRYTLFAAHQFYEGLSLRALLKQAAESLTERTAAENYETQNQPGIAKIPGGSQQEGSETQCTTEPVDSQGQTGGTQDTSEQTSQPF